MIMVIGCKQCGGDCPIGGVGIEVILNYWLQCCDKCHRPEERKRKLWFCSPECLTAFIFHLKLSDEVDIIKR